MNENETEVDRASTSDKSEAQDEAPPGVVNGFSNGNQTHGSEPQQNVKEFPAVSIATDGTEKQIAKGRRHHIMTSHHEDVNETVDHFFMVCMLRKFRCRKLMPNGSIVAARCYACLQFCTVIDFPNFGRECISRFENLIKKIVLPMH